MPQPVAPRRRGSRGTAPARSTRGTGRARDGRRAGRWDPTPGCTPGSCRRRGVRHGYMFSTAKVMPLSSLSRRMPSTKPRAYSRCHRNGGCTTTTSAPETVRGLGRLLELHPRVLPPRGLGHQQAGGVHRVDGHLVVIAQIDHVVDVGGHRVDPDHQFDAVVAEQRRQFEPAAGALGIHRRGRQQHLAGRGLEVLRGVQFALAHPSTVIRPSTGDAASCPPSTDLTGAVRRRSAPRFASAGPASNNVPMHVDHLVFAAGPDGLEAEVQRLGERFGAKFKDGGFHPRFGTRNNILPLTDGRYLEVVEVLDHPAADKAVYGQAVRARSELGGGWLGWVVRVDDLAPIEERLGRSAVDGARHFPDGRLLEWKQIGIKGLMADPQLPYFLKWESPADVLPSALHGETRDRTDRDQRLAPAGRGVARPGGRRTLRRHPVRLHRPSRHARHRRRDLQRSRQG